MKISTFILQHKQLLSVVLNVCFICILSFYFKTNMLNQTKHLIPTHMPSFNPHHYTNIENCAHLHNYADSESKCSYVTSESSCSPKGFINYLQIFYCSCGHSPVLGYALLLLWLVVLFYLLANTASDYFCPSLESLSAALKLSPIIAGTTLLPLGNGASDVFSSIASFTQSGEGDVGLNSVLGGAMFVSSFVVGVISILISSHQNQIKVDEPSFIRDVLFFLFSLCFLLMIIIFGRISVWVAICFASVYLVYICLVSSMHFLSDKRGRSVNPGPGFPSNNEFGEMGMPLMVSIDKGISILAEKDCSEELNQKQIVKFVNLGMFSSSCNFLDWFLYLLELPLSLPRRLTIPVVSDERWSKTYAVLSVTLAPILLSALWNNQRQDKGNNTSFVIFMTAGLIGVVLGNVALVVTKKSSPPKRCLIPWLLGGFFMSIIWTYLMAEELVSLLVSLGYILGISPSILGLTVLAWGNSVGDLISDVAIALSGGPDGVQIAISGCYAGPMFSTLVGLGGSLVLASWSEYPSKFVIPTDPYLYETLGFLVGSLLWALVVLPNKSMRLDKLLGIGLLAIYFCFLFLSLARVLGFLNFN